MDEMTEKTIAAAIGRLDLSVSSEVVVGINSVSKLSEVATAKILSYLRTPNLRWRLLLDLGQLRFLIGAKRVSLRKFIGPLIDSFEPCRRGPVDLKIICFL